MVGDGARFDASGTYWTQRKISAALGAADMTTSEMAKQKPRVIRSMQIPSPRMCGRRQAQPDTARQS
jgi:hypothetical protein